MNAAAELILTLDRVLTIRKLSAALRQTLKGQLQFDNPRYLEAVRLGRWTRNIPKVLKFYEELGRDGLRLPRGYIRPVVDLCRSRQIAFRIEDRRRQLPPCEFAFGGTLKSFQQRALEECLAKDFGVLSAPTGSGKTVMALAVVAARRQPTLIVVHTRELQIQWIERIGQFLGIPADAVGEIGHGKMRIGEALTVAMVQTLYKQTDAVAPRIGFVVVDECHRCPSRTFTEAVTAFDSRFMLGLSATPYRRDKLSQLIFWHLGNLSHAIDRRHLVASGDVLHAEVIWRRTDFSPYADAVNEYSRMLSELTADDQRNRMIVDDVAREARERSGTVLLLSDRRRHCEALQTLLHYRHGISAQRLT